MNRQLKNLRKALPQKKETKILRKKNKNQKETQRKSSVESRRQLQNKFIINILRETREGIITSKQEQDVQRKEYSKN